MPSIGRLAARVYKKIGLGGAPAGTVLFGLHKIIYRAVFWRRFLYASGRSRDLGAFGTFAYYDIAGLRKSRPVNGLALIFYLGAGDYLMATPFIEALHQAYPDLPIWAFASTSTDAVNSPLVAHFLRTNPTIDKVVMYRGRPRRIWTEYDFSDALKDVPKDFVVLPVVYDSHPGVVHRATSLLETFRLPVDLPVVRPIAYPAAMSDRAHGILSVILSRAGRVARRDLVFVHFGARSSGYEYPHVQQLVARLLRQDYLVASFSPVGLPHDNLIEIDVTTITPTDSIEILRALQNQRQRLAMISVNSLMWPISAALNIPNLGLHVFWDPSIHQYLYPNIFVMTRRFYPTVPSTRMFLASPSDYRDRNAGRGNSQEFIDYDPDFVATSFERMLAAV